VLKSSSKIDAQILNIKRRELQNGEAGSRFPNMIDAGPRDFASSQKDATYFVPC